MEYATRFGKKFGRMSRQLIWQRTLKNTMGDRDKAITRYNEHIDEVKAAVPPERLLLFSADQGWQPLCDFLEVPIPDKEFPNVNDRASIKKSLNKRIWTAYGILGAGLFLFTGALYALLSIVGD